MSACYILLDKSMQTDYLTSYIYKECAGIGVENFHPGALTVGVICGILNELHEQYEQMCQLTGKKATRLTGSGNGIRRNSLMRRLAEEMFKMPMEIPEYEEEAAYGAALTAGKLVAAM